MNKLLILGIVCALPISAFAEKNCTLQLNVRNYLDHKISSPEIVGIATQLTSSTDIKLAGANSDYSLEIYANLNLDHHDARFSYVFGSTQIWPSKHLQERSAVETQIDSPFMKTRKFTKAFLTDLVTKALQKRLKSCASIDQTIKGTGNGTLSPVDGDTYVTKTGATFKRIGSYWQDPSGLLWGEVLEREYTNASVDSPAVKACQALGARLPTAEEYRHLLSYFSQGSDPNRVLSKQGQVEFNALFPWSFGLFTTATRDAHGVGHDFHHTVGVSGQAMAHWELNVRCVK